MKKIAVIILLSLYLLSNFGISVNRFYCCGVLQSQQLAIALFKERPKDDKCCKHTQTVVKVSDSHEQTGTAYTAFATGFYLQHIPSYPAIYSFGTCGITASTNLSHAPPLPAGATPLYMRYCTYRI